VIIVIDVVVVVVVVVDNVVDFAVPIAIHKTPICETNPNVDLN